MTEELLPSALKACWEIWESKGDRTILKNVLCDDFRFSPNGYFHKSHINTTTDLNDKTKDSLSLTVGECSQIK